MSSSTISSIFWNVEGSSILAVSSSTTFSHTGTWKGHHCKCLLLVIWSSKWTMTLKVSCFGKQKRCYSLAWQCKGILWRKSRGKRRSVVWDLLPYLSYSPDFGSTDFHLLRPTRTVHKWHNPQKQRNWNQSFNSFRESKFWLLAWLLSLKMKVIKSIINNI